MTEHIDTLVTHAHLFTMQGEGVGYVPDGAEAVKVGKKQFSITRWDYLVKNVRPNLMVGARSVERQFT